MLSGKISPSGKLPDTAPFRADDYPYFDLFGDKNECIYEEDIYVGYRYFETFAKEKVRYPFGFGLTYTRFETDDIAKEENGKIIVNSVIQNIVTGQVYELDFDPEKKCAFVFETECLSDSLDQHSVTALAGVCHIISILVSSNDTGRTVRQCKLDGKLIFLALNFLIV